MPLPLNFRELNVREIIARPLVIRFGKAGLFQDCIQKNASYRIVAAIVWILDVGVEPIVRVLGIVGRTPKVCRQCEPLPQECLVEWNDVDIGSLGSDSLNGAIVLGMNGQAVGPSGKVDAHTIPDSVVGS